MTEIIIVSPKFCKAISIFINVSAITLYPLIISKDTMSDVTLNHERIHLKQQRELWLFGFYFLYILYWLKFLIDGGTCGDAYYNIPFEKEAYENQKSLNYLESRKSHAWKNYS